MKPWFAISLLTCCLAGCSAATPPVTESSEPPAEHTATPAERTKSPILEERFVGTWVDPDATAPYAEAAGVGDRPVTPESVVFDGQRSTDETKVYRYTLDPVSSIEFHFTANDPLPLESQLHTSSQEQTEDTLREQLRYMLAVHLSDSNHPANIDALTTDIIADLPFGKFPEGETVYRFDDRFLLAVISTAATGALTFEFLEV